MENNVIAIKGYAKNLLLNATKRDKQSKRYAYVRDMQS